MITLYAATSNPGKLRDFAVAAEEEQNTLIQPLPGLDSINPPPKTSPPLTLTPGQKPSTTADFCPTRW